MDKKCTRMNVPEEFPFYTVCAGFLSGALLLSVMSTIQKVIAGFNPWLPKGYIVPVLFGGISGGLIAIYIAKTKALHNRLLIQVNELESILPICSCCKKIREPEADPKDQKSWQEIEAYISDRTSSRFSHAICPHCADKLYGMKIT